MSYIDNALGKDERIVVQAKVSWLSQIKNYLLGILLLLIGILLLSDTGIFGLTLILAGAWFFLMAFLNVITTELALTDKKIIAKFGLIRRNTIELRNEKIESLKVNQGIVGRILNYGSLVISGTGGSNAPIPYIGNPMDFRKKVNEFLEESD